MVSILFCAFVLDELKDILVGYPTTVIGSDEYMVEPDPEIL